ncbi:hypothetical protein NDU88_003410 [Pleurodeles waltl]|uniref:Uncharacterized protein n=1 Tax=Pleurodeles waltl TaxID=8319 RepID=A0AAV7M5A4_PLEWA|nr:hypothetical protein NDU88_003410 [Pleurodeles waltl]
MATSVLRDHAYGGFLPPQDISSNFLQSSQSSYQDHSSSKSDSEDPQSDPLPRKKQRKTRHSMSEVNPPAGKNLLFSPEDIIHPRSTEWVPNQEVGNYVQDRLCKSFEKEVHNTLRSECPRPSLLGKVAEMPELDPSMATFLRTFAKDPKKGLGHAWRGCQDKLLDVSGPLTKILDLAIQSKESDIPLDTDALLQWAQRVIYLLGNANCAMSNERRRSFLIRLDPKLAELANNEAGSSANDRRAKEAGQQTQKTRVAEERDGDGQTAKDIPHLVPHKACGPGRLGGCQATRPPRSGNGYSNNRKPPPDREREGSKEQPGLPSQASSRDQHRGQQQQDQPTLAGETPPTPPTLPVEKQDTPWQDPIRAIGSRKPTGTSVGSVSEARKKPGRHSV